MKRKDCSDNNGLAQTLVDDCDFFEPAAPVSSEKRQDDGCDIFEPSVYTPDESKYRAEYIKRITAKITAELDASLLAEEAPDDEEPSGELQVTGKDPEKHLKLILKYLRGPRGFNGSADNLVVLSEAEYERLRVKDPNKFYFTYEGDTPVSEESMNLDTHILSLTSITEHSAVSRGNINNNTLNI